MGSIVTNISREQEEAALQAVLQSHLFKKSSSQSQFLAYICQKYFAGAASQIKEYNVAVEALGRTSNFHPKLDPIVRVEGCRLRKRLKKFYETEGKTSEIQLTIPACQYVPVFHRQNENPPAILFDTDKDNSEQSGATDFAEEHDYFLDIPNEILVPASRSDRRRWVMVCCLIAAGILISTLIISLHPISKPYLNEPPPMKDSAPETADPANSRNYVSGNSLLEEVHIQAGSHHERYLDPLGRVWTGDRYFSGGLAIEDKSEKAASTSESGLYRTAREGDFSYEIPLKPGAYELRLHFFEFIKDAASQKKDKEERSFCVYLNGIHILKHFDIAADASSPRTADIRVFQDVHPVDGKLRLNFVSQKSKALLNAIEVIPGLPGQMRPIRILGSSSSYTSPEGEAWLPDHFFRGGRLSQTSGQVANTKDPAQYQSERYGNFSYHIPVAPGFYAVTLKFAETYFGPSNLGKGGAGSRQFNVFCNGKELLHNFDIYREAGGENRALVKTFHHISSNPQGKIILGFVSVLNFANICAIEVKSETAI